MKKNKIYIIVIIALIIFLFIPKQKNSVAIISKNTTCFNGVNKFHEKYIKENYYENEKIDDIIYKVSRYMNSPLKENASFIVKYSVEKGVNPYLSSAIILHETGCEWKCSYLSRVCNNYAGNKASSGSYRVFSTAEEGIKFAVDKLANYYNAGKTTPYEIGPSYAVSSAWPNRVTAYMNKLRNS